MERNILWEKSRTNMENNVLRTERTLNIATVTVEPAQENCSSNVCSRGIGTVK
jgi:hypothetical protein